MSQHPLAPTNLFYHWRDPLPPEFPEPSTGDTYFNVSSNQQRIFYDSRWHDVIAGDLSGGGYLTAEQAAEQFVATNKLIVSTAPASGTPAGGPGTVWFQY